jgi:NAD(P)-dependent dehydrogenase (short-subunit alcohol dehydrogenase family)
MSGHGLKGKVVIVTGGGGGLGRAMAVGLADRGARVAVLDIDRNSAKSVVADITASHGSEAAIAIICNIAVESECRAAVKRTAKELGGLHVLVNNAAIGMRFISEHFVDQPPKFWEFSADKFQALMDVNVRGTFLMSQAVVHHLMDQGWGRIVNVTTSLDSMMRGGNTPYGQAKASIEAAAASWAEDLEGTGVTVNVLIPGGAANTTMIPSHASFDRDKLNQPVIMVAPICWLASDESDGVTRKRFIGRDWDPALPAAEAAEAAGGPAAWGALPARPRSFS